MKQNDLRERIRVAKLMPGVAHLPAFGLILYGNQKGPVCELCGGVDAPIIDGKHLDGWCKHEADARGTKTLTNLPIAFFTE
jgi:hypothetical protein